MTFCFCLFFVVSKLIFISGPVVVSPADVITFQTRFKSHQSYSKAKWFRFKGNVKEELNDDMVKYDISNTSDGTGRQTLTVATAGEDDSAGYQLSLDNIMSNKINTLVNGMYFQY